MRKKFTQIGNSWGLIFPKPILELLNVNPVLNEVDITVIEDKLIITKSKEEGK